MNSSETTLTLVNEKAAALLRTLLYFNLFRYPLTLPEIHKTASIPHLSLAETEKELAALVQQGIVRQHSDYYYLGKNNALVQQRIEGNQRAQKYLAIAHKKARLMGHFPFIRAVMVSGSLSKGVSKPDADIDYFLVTDPGRLWIARTLLILYKKALLFNSHEYWCVNYFVDTDHLEIEDKNLFTATELKWLLPVWNPDLYQQVLGANAWADKWFPNFGPRKVTDCAPYRRSWIKKLGEALLSGKLGDRLDAWCMRRTLGRWQKKFGHFDAKTFEVTLRSRTYVSKHHPSDFQKQVRTRLVLEKQELEAELHIQLPHVPFFDPAGTSSTERVAATRVDVNSSVQSTGLQ